MGVGYGYWCWLGVCMGTLVGYGFGCPEGKLKLGLSAMISWEKVLEEVNTTLWDDLNELTSTFFGSEKQGAGK